MPSWETFGGYESVNALLRDRHLSDSQKVNALKNWRAALLRMRPIQTAHADQINTLLDQLDAGLDEIGGRSPAAKSRSGSQTGT